MHYVVYGAGGIGGTIGARLHLAGFRVTLIARGEHARVMGRDGLRFIAPDGEHTLQIPCVTQPEAVAWGEDRPVVLLCMKSQHTEAALRDLAGCAPASTPVICVQNGVANERAALRYFAQVYASVVNLPATHLEPGVVITHADGHGGILDTGRFPHGTDALSERITADLSEAGFSARPDEHVMRQKYAKLLLNLANILQAALPLDTDISAIGRTLRKEALAVFAQAGIGCASREEITARQRGVYRMVDLPGYPRGAGSSWQSLARGTGDLETEFLNGEICLLGRLHGVATPANDACVHMARALLAQGGKPGQFSLQDLQARISSP